MKINFLASITTITAFCTILFSALPSYGAGFKNTDTDGRDATDVHFEYKGLDGPTRTVDLKIGQKTGDPFWDNIIRTYTGTKNGDIWPDGGMSDYVFKLIVKGSFKFSYPTKPKLVDGTPVPEPITILGSLTALGFGTILKRKYCKEVEKQTV